MWKLGAENIVWEKQIRNFIMISPCAHLSYFSGLFFFVFAFLASSLDDFPKSSSNFCFNGWHSQAKSCWFGTKAKISRQASKIFDTLFLNPMKSPNPFLCMNHRKTSESSSWTWQWDLAINLVMRILWTPRGTKSWFHRNDEKQFPGRGVEF